jgi:hypothetical protein
MPTTFETIQYRASPAGNWNVKNPNISGIIHSIIRLVDACLASADGIVLIFCITNMEPPTSTGRRGETGLFAAVSARSNHKKERSMGMVSCTHGSHE